MKDPHILILMAVVVAVIGTGTVFFRLIEGWSWVDAYFFSVVTLSTVGYGSLVPETDIGKIGTTIYILTGIGLFAWVLNSFAQKMVHRGQRMRDAHHEHSPLPPRQEGDG